MTRSLLRPEPGPDHTADSDHTAGSASDAGPDPARGPSSAVHPSGAAPRRRARRAGTPADVGAFLDRYGVAFATGDLVTAARCYVTPALVLSGDDAVVFRRHDEIVEGFRAVVAQHRAWGLASLRHEVLDTEDLTDGLTEATVRWTYHAARNRARFRQRYRYVLRSVLGEGPRIQSVIVLDGPESGG